MTTALQYLKQPAGIPFLIEALERQPRQGPAMHTRLLHALGAYAPVAALPALVDSVETLAGPDHRQLAVVCLEKIITRHGDAARQRLWRQRGRLAAARDALCHEAKTTAAFTPEVPWDHRPGTPG